MNLSISEVRATLPSVIDQVVAGDEVVVTRHGTPVAVIVRPDRVRPGKGVVAVDQAQTLGTLLAEGAKQSLDDVAITSEAAEALLAFVRSGRETR